MFLTAVLQAAVFYVSFCLSLPIHDASNQTAVSTALPRLVIYFQTTHDEDGNPISMLPLVTEKNIALTHLIVCSFHINLDGEIHLNDYPPSEPIFDTLWNETTILQQAGVKVMGMVGGAASGSYSTTTLDSTDDSTFEYYYGQLRDVILQYGLQGVDLDVEQSMTQAGITRLVRRLYADFGDGFVVTLAPVASALYGGSNLSGFRYGDLEMATESGSGLDMIAFYNAQFYGFGSMSTPATFEKIVAAGWDPAQIVAGQLTSPSNGYGYTSIPTLNKTVTELVQEYGTIGGIMGWEYFNSAPGGTAQPWEWAQEMTAILRPNETVQLTITNDTAARLDAAWVASVNTDDEPGKSHAVQGVKLVVKPNVDYFSMVTA